MRHLFQIVGSFLTFSFHKTRLRCDVIFSDHCITQSLLSARVEIFLENRSTFAEVMGN